MNQNTQSSPTPSALLPTFEERLATQLNRAIRRREYTLLQSNVNGDIAYDPDGPALTITANGWRDNHGTINGGPLATDLDKARTALTLSLTVVLLTKHDLPRVTLAAPVTQPATDPAYLRISRSFRWHWPSWAQEQLTP